MGIKLKNFKAISFKSQLLIFILTHYTVQIKTTTFNIHIDPTAYFKVLVIETQLSATTN